VSPPLSVPVLDKGVRQYRYACSVAWAFGCAIICCLVHSNVDDSVAREGIRCCPA
jgi:hypothetical protein